MIEPTPGRVVWFYPKTGDADFAKYGAPFAAHVAYVWNARCVNLAVILPDGSRFVSRTSVALLQDDDAALSESCYAMWMPYQIGQAKKNQ